MTESDYPNEPKLRDLPFNIKTAARWPVLGLIRFYQRYLSQPNVCRFYPSCSHYGYQAIYKYGVLRGIPMTVWRLLRCNPFNPGGYDPVPDLSRKVVRK